MSTIDYLSGNGIAMLERWLRGCVVRFTSGRPPRSTRGPPLPRERAPTLSLIYSGNVGTLPISPGSSESLTEGALLPIMLAGEEPFHIGRARDCDLTLWHNTVGRTALLIYVREGWLWVQDTGSGGGSRLRGGRLVDRPWIMLEDGDQLWIGEVGFKVRFAEL